MRILVTGGFGFIGQKLCRKLLCDPDNTLVVIDCLLDKVHGPDPDVTEFTSDDRVNFVQADICDAAAMAQALEGVDVVYHLAAETGTGQSMYEIGEYCRTNVTGTAVMLEQIVRNTDSRPKTFILSSSRSVYGEGAYQKPGQSDRIFPLGRQIADMDAGRFDFYQDDTALDPVPTRETDPVNPASIYASTKLSQEQLCSIACQSVGITFCALRLQNVYGPGQSMRNPYTGIISIFTNILRQDGKIDIFEDGLESRDFVFVEDVADAFMAAADLPKDAPTIINVGSGVGSDVNTLVGLLETRLGKPGSSHVSGRFRPGDIRHNFADVTHMKQFLNLTQPVDLAQGVSLTVDWALTQPVEEDLSAKATEELKMILKGS